MGIEIRNDSTLCSQMCENVGTARIDRSKPGSKCTVRRYMIRMMHMRLEHKCARQMRLKGIGCSNSRRCVPNLGPRHPGHMGPLGGGRCLLPFRVPYKVFLATSACGNLGLSPALNFVGMSNSELLLLLLMLNDLESIHVNVNTHTTFSITFDDSITNVHLNMCVFDGFPK